MSCGKCLQCKEGYQCFWEGTQWVRPKSPHYKGYAVDIEESSPFTQEMWDKFSNWTKIKKENMTKRERFLKAGGLFERKEKEVTTTSFNLKPGDVVYIEFDDTYQAGKRNKVAFNNCQITFKFAAVNREDKDYPNQKAHFENILSNTKSDTWIASRGREIKIIDLADKHLVNIMRYLVAHWMEIKQEFLINLDQFVYSSNTMGAVKKHYDHLKRNTNSIMRPAHLGWVINCFDMLVGEFTSRFGYDSLNSIYEGN